MDGFAELLQLIDDCLPRRAGGTPDTEREKSDVVHDLLAHLAEQMVEMNKAKQAEVKGFLDWLERTIGAKVDDLANKTALREYHEHSLDEVIAVLVKNRKKLKVEPKGRSVQEQIEREFSQSMSKLTPLKARIQLTDDLIDRIVYKLYGLTEEEVAIVEGSVGRSQVKDVGNV